MRARERLTYFIAAGGVFGAALGFSPTAGAYCRTVTTPIPADFPQTTECFQPERALPLWWSNACVSFSVQQSASKQISLVDAETHVLSAFERWSAASCAGGGNPSITVSDEGPVACSTVEYSSVGPNQNVVVFRDADWPHPEDKYDTLALTTVSFNEDTGEIYDADIEINTAATSIVVSGTPGAKQYAFDAIITHEAGHFLGLAHSPVDSAVMYAFYSAGSFALTSDDVAGVCAIYAPDGARAHDVDAGATTTSAVSAAATCDPTPRHGFGSACGPVGDGSEVTVTKKGCAVSEPGAARSAPYSTLVLVCAAGAVAIARRRRAARIRA